MLCFLVCRISDDGQGPNTHLNIIHHRQNPLESTVEREAIPALTSETLHFVHIVYLCI
jgi:hypothetical protein